MGLWVLIVDDEEMIRENLVAYLEDEGMQVMAVSSAEEAIQYLKAGYAFAVCIMDMRLPGIDGNMAIRVLHAIRATMKFIVHTGSVNYSLPGDLRAIGLEDEQIYRKPLSDMAPLAAAVRKLGGCKGGNAQ
jgi:CheY-like chemotaxis protein